MNSLFLTNNPNLCSTSRILQSWVELGRDRGLKSSVLVQNEGELLDLLSNKGIPCQSNPMLWPDRKHLLKCLWHTLKAANWVRKQKSEIIHCNEHDIYPFAAQLKRLVRRPIVCHVRYKLDRGFAEWAFGKNRMPDALLWTSHQQKADSASAIEGIVPEERQHIVRLGLNLDHFGNDHQSGIDFRTKHGIQPDQIMIGIPSPLRPRKRIHDFIEIISRIAHSNKKIVGVIAGGEIPGDESYRRQIEQQISETNLGNRLQWVGYLEPVEPFHHACDISVSTSEYETFGNSVCEAMACEKPVAAYRGGSIAEVVESTGLVVDTGDLDGLTQAVQRLVDNEVLRKDLGKQAKERVATEFNPRKSFDQLMNIYQNILKN